MAVIKACHGLIRMAQASKTPVPRLAVACIEEAYELPRQHHPPLSCSLVFITKTS